MHMLMPLLIGTYTIGESFDGIYEAEFDTDTGSLCHVRLAIPQRDPSYLTVSADGKRLYAVMETPRDGRVFSYRLTENGWEQTGFQPSQGEAPCHLMLDEESSMLDVANYMDGVVSFFTLSKDGALKSPAQAIALHGHGPNVRQECAHAHQCVKQGESIWVSDLGADKVRVFERDGDRRFEEKAALVSTTPGAGPRHLVMSADGQMLYLICELQNVLYAYRKTGDGYKEAGRYEYLPEGARGAAAAAVRLSDDGRFLFASSRLGFDGVALFELDAHTRLPALCGLYPTGACPRDILPIGDFLLCACQEENLVQVMRLDREHKRLELLGGTKVNKPVCLITRPSAGCCN